MAENQRDDWTCRDDPSVPLESLQNPSYASGEPYVDVNTDGRYLHPPGSPDGFTPSTQDRNADGTHTGFSGRLRGTVQPWGDTYALRIEDESSKINVNGGLLDDLNRDAGIPDGIPDYKDPVVGPVVQTATQTGWGWNAQLARILDLLGNARESDWDTDGVVDAWEEVIQNRPKGGYRSIEELRAAIGTTKDLTPYLTVSSWVDTKVIRPNAYGAQVIRMRYETAPADMQKDRPALVPEGGGASPREPECREPARPVCPALRAGGCDLDRAHRPHPVRGAPRDGRADRPGNPRAQTVRFADGVRPVLRCPRARHDP